MFWILKVGPVEFTNRLAMDCETENSRTSFRYTQAKTREELVWRERGKEELRLDM